MNRWIEKVRDHMNEYQFDSPEEDEKHSRMILQCCSGNQEAQEYVIDKIKAILKRYRAKDVDHLAYEIFKKEYGLSIIHDLVENREKKYNNIECIDYDWIEVEKSDGTWKKLDIQFDSEEEFEIIIKRAIQHDNKPDINRENPLVESKLLSGARVTAALKPAGYRNYLFIKLFNSFSPTEESYLKNGGINKEIIKFTKILFKILPSIVIIGGINRGKTTFLKYLVGLLNENLKIGTLASDFEAKLQEIYPDRNIVSMQETPKYGLLEEFKWMLRANRDVIILEEARGAEVKESAKASRRGIGCTFLTGHVLDPQSVPEEFAEMYLEGGIPVDINFLLYRFARAFNITYRIRQLEDGRRIVDDISEIVVDIETRTYKRNILFSWNPKTEIHQRVGGIEGEDLLMRMEYYNLTEEEKKYLKMMGDTN
ncbi:ATPase, T2SS/T4P/T4SS family [Clostridiisalibacter paucivorans]|uniref:ATPase, T2SS/T4P/T4SS family n=1 Tax=Clostridiisalibacter paucivorans TaxID=408753 RepID=UPI00047E10CD|nr:ATPase, T2SS/T4P/T4SS family [Clostridiisalibacter paucivorans]